MSKPVKEILAVSTECIREKTPFLSERYSSRALSDPGEIKRARQLATVGFVKLGKIGDSEVTDEGILRHDNILPLSTFFATFDNKTDEVCASGRLLWRPGVTIDDLRLPTDYIDPEYADYLSQHKPGTIGEIGSFAKVRGHPQIVTLKMIRQLWNYADERGVKTLVCGLEPNVYPRYQSMFGDALTALSDDTIKFPGIHGLQKPLMIDVNRGYDRQKETEHYSSLQKLERFVVRNYITQDLSHPQTYKTELQNENRRSYLKHDRDHA